MKKYLMYSVFVFLLFVSVFSFTQKVLAIYYYTAENGDKWTCKYKAGDDMCSYNELGKLGMQGCPKLCGAGSTNTKGCGCEVSGICTKTTIDFTVGPMGSNISSYQIDVSPKSDFSYQMGSPYFSTTTQNTTLYLVNQLYYYKYRPIYINPVLINQEAYVYSTTGNWSTVKITSGGSKNSLGACNKEISSTLTKDNTVSTTATTTSTKTNTVDIASLRTQLADIRAKLVALTAQLDALVLTFK